MHSYLQRTQQAIEEAVHGMTTEELAWRPPGKWSATDILEHLSLTYRGTAKGLERCLQAGRPNAGGCSWRERVAGFIVTGLRYMPAGRQSPAVVAPKGIAPETALEELRRYLAEADEALGRCEAQFGAGRKITDHPFLGPLTAQQWRTFHWVHARHHMKQIAVIRRQIAVSK